MLRILAIALTFLCAVNAYAQYDPSDYFTTGTSVKVWHDPSTASNCKTSAPATATNGQGCYTLEDSTSNNYDATQTSGGSQPIVRTNTINTSMQSIELAGKYMEAASLNSVIKNVSKVALGGMFMVNNLTDNHYFYRVYDNNWNGSRVRFSVESGKPAINVANDDAGTSVLIFQSSTTITEDVWHTILFEVDTVANVGRVWVDGSALTNGGGTSTLASPGAIINTDGQESRVSISGLGNWNVADYFIATGEFMDSTQRGDWNTDLTAKFSASPTATPTITPTPTVTLTPTAGPSATPTLTPTPTATPTPTNTPTVSTTVPCKQEWKDQWVTWSAYQYSYMNTHNGWTTWSPTPYDNDENKQLTAHYYDATLINLIMPAIVGDTPTISSRLPVMRRSYRDGYLDYYGSNASGYTVFTAGLREDWEQLADATSKQYVYDLSRNAAFAGGDPANTESVHGEFTDGGARENAYRIMAELDARALGFATRDIDAYIDQALDHLEEMTVTQSYVEYVKPFMVAIVAKALIQVFEEYPSYPGVANILPAIEIAYDWIWDETWIPYDVGDTKSQAFLYALPDGTESEFGGAPDLNGLILPPYGWLFKETGVNKWRVRGDEIFCGSITVMDGFGFHERGPNFGSFSTAATADYGKKQLNQTYQWSHRYIEWAESPFIGGGGSSGGGKRMLTLGGG